ncbi:MAG: hypothetical protein V1489_01085, partial [Candidatus Liptonbacteria bacterium]
PVPASMEQFHRSMLKMIAYERNVTALPNIAETDPLKASFIMQAQEANYMKALSDLQVQYDFLSKDYGVPLFAEQSTPPILARMLRINTARAVFPAIPVIDPTEMAFQIWQIAKKVLLDFVRDKIVHRLVQQVIKWVQGGGSPQFVTDWKSFLINAGDIIAGQTIDEIAPGFCRSFAPMLRFQLETAYLSNPPPITCTVDQIVQNIENFYQDFTQGGWLAYSETIMPSGNYFGQLLQASEVIELAKIGEQAAQASDAQASGGILSQRKCIRYEEYCTAYERCLANGDATFCDSLKCPPNQPEERCTEYQITTPGQIIGQTLYNSLSSPMQRIVTAQDVNALVSALINSALNKLTKLIDGKPDPNGLLGMNAATIGTATGGDTSGECATLTGEQLTACMAAIACGDLTGEEKTLCLSNWRSAGCSAEPTPGTIGLSGTIGVGTAENPGDGTANLGGTLTLGGISCTPVVTPYGATSTPSVAGGCAQENCGNSCNCRCRDKLTDGNFCFLSAVQSAQNTVLEKCAAGEDVGLTNCGEPVIDNQKYAQALATVLQQSGLSVDISGIGAYGGEMGVTGNCSSGGTTCGTAGCIGSPRKENFAIISSDHRIRGNNIARAVCTP